jgi:hypothetical protein
MIIKVKNTLDSSAQYTFTGAPYSANVGTIGVKNINAFQSNWAVQIGKTGEEKSEIGVLSSGAISGTSLVLVANTSFDHPEDTPVYAIKFDQLVFKRSTSGTAGTAVAITNGTISITPDSAYTQFDDTSGATGYAYKVAFRNSVTGDVSSDSTWLTTSGYSFYSLAKLRDRIRNKLFSIGYLKQNDNRDSQIDDWINEWLETMNNTAVDVNQDYSLGSVDVAHGTDGLATINSSDFKEVRRVWFTTDGVDNYKARQFHITDFLPGEEFNETHPYYFNYGDNVIGKKPTGNAGTAKVVYYKMGTVLANDTDELPIVMRPYTKSFVDYGVCQAYYFDGSATMGDRFMAAANGERDLFRTQITPRAKSGPTYITFTDALGADAVFDDLQNYSA